LLVILIHGHEMNVKEWYKKATRSYVWWKNAIYCLK